MTVTFHVVEPDTVSAKWMGDYPWASVLDRVGAFDLATGEFHLQSNVLGTETFCTVFEGPLRLLGAFTKDSLTALLAEYKGHIEEVPLRVGEGVIDGAYAAFFPNNILGLVRSSVKAPGAASMAHWLSVFLPEDACFMPALPKADALAGLNRPPEDVVNVFFRIRRKLIPWLREVRPDVAAVLERASTATRSSKVGIELGVETKKEKAAWWPGMKATIADLAAAQLLTDFDAARVHLTGRDNVNLKSAYVTERVFVDVFAKKRFNHEHAAEALVEAYDRAQEDILAAVEARRGRDASRRAARSSSGDDPEVDQPPLI